MQCPIDGTTLAITDREGIEIDYCPQCRGVWLDRGELDKIIERADRDDDDRYRGPEDRGRSDRPRDDDRYRSDDRYRDDRYERQPYRKKKKGLLGELFDFD